MILLGEILSQVPAEWCGGGHPSTSCYEDWSRHPWPCCHSPRDFTSNRRFLAAPLRSLLISRSSWSLDTRYNSCAYLRYHFTFHSLISDWTRQLCALAYLICAGSGYVISIILSIRRTILFNCIEVKTLFTLRLMTVGVCRWFDL